MSVVCVLLKSIRDHVCTSKHFSLFPPFSSISAVGRSENPGVPVLFGGHNLPPLIEIGLVCQNLVVPWQGPGTFRDDRPEYYIIDFFLRKMVLRTVSK